MEGKNEIAKNNTKNSKPKRLWPMKKKNQQYVHVRMSAFPLWREEETKLSRLI